MRSVDRILVIAPIDGKDAKAVTGLIDKRLFTGENKLHAIQEHGLWYLKYEMGGLPDPLKQKYTSFAKLTKLVNEYLKKRNIEIKEILD